MKWRIALHPDQRKRLGYFIIVSSKDSSQWGHAIFATREAAEKQLLRIFETSIE